MSAAVRPSFDFFGQLLDARGVISTADGPALALLATTHTMLIQVGAELLKLDGLTTVPDGKGGVKDHPLVRQERNLRKDLWNALGRFGLTPADRGRAAALGPTEHPDPAWGRLT
jgi:phage terminase small subunit